MTMTGKTLIAFSTKTGINTQAAYAIADALKTTYGMDVTTVDLQNGSPDITPFQNIIVGGGVSNKSVYGEAVDFLEQDFEGRNVALFFCCQDEKNPKAQSTDDNTVKVLAKNKSLKLIDVAAFGGCMLKQEKAVMDDLNMNRIREWAIDLGKKLSFQPPKQVVPMPPVEVITVADMPVMEGVFEIILDTAGKFRFHLKAANGQIIAVSQAYGAKESALTGIASIKTNAPIAKITDLTTGGPLPEHQAGIVQDPAFEIQFNAPDRYRFHLKAANGEIIAVSQSYLSKQSAENGIASVKTNAAMAKIIDQTTAVT
jgi:uncharacterized protein YegP (UPF0339 family)/menaquinone-dependent protoporphyrinogen IX oxidase